MRRRLLALLRRTTLAWALVLGAGVVLAPYAVETVAAKKKAKKRAAKKKRGGAQEREAERRAIETEDVGTKKEFGIDQSLGKVKDLKPAAETSKGPTLSLAALTRGQAEALVEEKLDEEIGLSSQLLDLTPDCTQGAPVRFRLADLYWEKSKRAFFRSQDAKTPEKDRSKYEGTMKRLQGQSIDHYQKLTDECEDFDEYAKVLFFLGNALTEVERHREAANYFQRIIKDFEKSEWVPNAWFMLGEFFFDHANDVEKALRSYRKAAENTASPVYGYAVYKQGWCYVNTGEWDQALDRFRLVVQISEDKRQQIEERGRIGLRREGLKDYVRAYSNVGDPDKALREFRKVGGAEEVPWMLEQLGNWYVNNDSHDSVVAIYREIIKTFPRSTRLPVYQGRIVDAVSKTDKKQIVPQAKLLTQYFTKMRQRMAKGDLNPEEKKSVTRDMAEAEEIAENSLRRLALEHHEEAKKLRGPSRDRNLKLAEDLYSHYLEVFPTPKPDAEVNYVFFMRFYLAEVQYEVENFAEAAKNYEKVLAMNPTPKNKKEKEMVMAAVENTVYSYREMVSDLDRKSPPEISGTAPKPIPELKQTLISSAERYVKYFGNTGDNVVGMRYMGGRICYEYNHFDCAAVAFHDIVANHPAHENACYSANLILDMYNVEGARNYAALRDSTRTFLDNKKLACGGPDRAKFAEIHESSSYNLIKVDYEDKRKYLAAANLYLEFYKNFPQSKLADDAVYESARNFDLANRLDKANEVRAFLVEKVANADPGLVKETLYNMAASYERIVDFDDAAKYLELFAQKYPDDKRSKDALFNASLYRATLFQFDAARKNREEYLSPQRYGNDDEAHRVAFDNCEAMEREAEQAESKAGKKDDKGVIARWQAANDCYAKFVQRRSYEDADPDLVCHAQFRRAEIMRTKTNYDKGAAEQGSLILKNWPRWKRAGPEKTLRCAAAVGELKFRELPNEFKNYKGMLVDEMKLTDKLKSFEASAKAKVKARDQLIEKYKAVAEIGAAEWALAALYQIGEAYQDSVDKVLRASIQEKVGRDKVPEEIKAELRQRLKNDAAPIEEQAIEAFRLCVEKAHELGVYNEWPVKARRRLQQLRPDAFAAIEERLAPIRFTEKLTVQRNGLVVADGEGWRSLEPSAANGSGKRDAAASAESKTAREPRNP
ncbi:MAG: tetratricopeptide repeat protein [Deltaproteobacteria bacterium]|nr:tetratricopeptide repeat protein [Deltaproteobacteria bacterium]